jgi:hypothetical protein
MFWRILVALLKPCVLLALFDFVRRASEVTGLQISVIDPMARTISSMTGLSSSYSAILVVGVVALGLLEILTALGKVAVSTIPR